MYRDNIIEAHCPPKIPGAAGAEGARAGAADAAADAGGESLLYYNII